MNGLRLNGQNLDGLVIELKIVRPEVESEPFAGHVEQEVLFRKYELTGTWAMAFAAMTATRAWKRPSYVCVRQAETEGVW